MNIRIKFEPRDLWLGVYWKHGGTIQWPVVYVYVCLLPCLPIILTLPRFLRWDVYRNGYWSLGCVVSRDAILSQQEPYEVVSAWEPYVSIYLGPWHMRCGVRLRNRLWMQRLFGRVRRWTERARVEEPETEDVEF